MKKLRKISFWISWGSVINSIAVTVFAVIVHALYGLGYASYGLNIVAETLFVMSIMIIGIAVTVSSSINDSINESIKRKAKRTL